jgi:hypothetical protein
LLEVRSKNLELWSPARKGNSHYVYSYMDIFTRNEIPAKDWCHTSTLYSWQHWGFSGVSQFTLAQTLEEDGELQSENTLNKSHILCSKHWE